jgi:hypothetical protein
MPCLSLLDNYFFYVLFQSWNFANSSRNLSWRGIIYRELGFGVVVIRIRASCQTSFHQSNRFLVTDSQREPAQNPINSCMQSKTSTAHNIHLLRQPIKFLLKRRSRHTGTKLPVPGTYGTWYSSTGRRQMPKGEGSNF